MKCADCPCPSDLVCAGQEETQRFHCLEASRGNRLLHIVNVSRYKAALEPLKPPPIISPPEVPQALPRRPMASGRKYLRVLPEYSFVTTKQLVQDTLELGSHLDPSIEAVVAIARSGLLPGSLLAMHLHLPLFAVSRVFGVVDPGGGWRITPHFQPYDREAIRHVLLIDDTSATCHEMAAEPMFVEAAFPGALLTRAVIYCHPRCLGFVDACVALYGGLHFLEWNWEHAGHGADCGYDFDGILCEDCTPENNDDGPRYLCHLEHARPAFLPRRLEVPLVVTGRHEKYRRESLEWLERHGVRVRELIMRNFPLAPGLGFNHQIAMFKAFHYAQSTCLLFAESDQEQAELINEATGRAVLCPRLGRLLPGRETDAQRAARLIQENPPDPHNGNPCGCGGTVFSSRY